MLENIKKRIIHFYTHGNIIEDFVEARRRKTAKLRRIIRACFYIQCALAAGCIASALLMGTSGVSAIIAGAVAVCVVAFISLGGGTAEKTILYILDLAYAVICFIVGGLGGSSAFIVCGVLMLLSAGAALGGFFAAWCRQYLLDFSPARITRSDYTRLTAGLSEPPPEAPQMVPPPAPAPPPPPPKSEMEMLAEKLSEILGAIPEIKLSEPAEKGKENAKSDTEIEQKEAAPNADGAPREKVGDSSDNPGSAETNTENPTTAGAVLPEVVTKPAETDKASESGGTNEGEVPADNGTGNAENAAPAVLPDVVDISDMSVDFSIDG